MAARDEAERVAATLAGLARCFPRATVWLADDGSTDATAELARAAGARVLGRGAPTGKGEAMTMAARRALDEVSEDPARRPVFVLCDGDLGDCAGELAPLAEEIRRADGGVAVAVFARRLGGGLGVAVGFARWAIRRRCGLVTDAPISGQRALSAGALADVLPFAHGFGMEIGMTIDAVRAGHQVVEIELDLHHRASGRTPAGFLHRGRQLADFVRVYLARG